jgi:superfamily I DNA and/or RNA helicase
MDISKRLKDLVLAIEAERTKEESYYRTLALKKTQKERIESGILWHPLKLQKKFYSVGELIELEFEKVKNDNLPHKLKVGVGVTVFSGEHSYRGTISFIRRTKISVILSSAEYTELIDDYATYGVELIYDERPYRIMQAAIEEVMRSKLPHIKELYHGIEKADTFDQSIDAEKHSHYHNAELNEYQNEAVKAVAGVERMGIIHGPPGTGKTTTLVALINYLSKHQKKILVTASSNNAVDLLAKKLYQKKLPVLRVGNVSRIDDDLVDITVNEKLRNHKDWQHIKKVKIEAEEARRQAKKFKRTFKSADRQNRKTMFQESKELKRWARDLEDKLLDTIISESSIICSTLIGASNRMIDDLLFDTVIIDEASQALEPECWNVMLKAKRVIFAGDHLQLPPTVKSPEAIKLGLSTTLLDRMSGVIKHSYLLHEQYRMNDEILAFSNQQFYDNKLFSNLVCKDKKIEADEPAVTFIDTSGCGFDEKLNPESRSLSNEGEFFILREHFLSKKSIYSEHSIGIISPYAQQVRDIREKLTDEEEFRGIDLTVNSIDGFQGQEKDIIYISLVRSNDKGEIGFLKDTRRINVALTRARMKLIIIGDGATLSQEKIYSDLMDFIEKTGQYLSAWEYMS